MRETELKPDKDGYYRRNIGFTSKGDRGFTSKRDGRRIPQPKISLGRAKRTAKARLARIVAVLLQMELEFSAGWVSFT